MSKSSLAFILGDKANDSMKTHGEPLKKAPKCPYQISIIQQPEFCKVCPPTQNSTNASYQQPLSEHRPIFPPPVLKLVFDDESVDTENNEHATQSKCEGQTEGNKKVLDLLRNKQKIPNAAHYSSFFVTVDVIPEDAEINDRDNKRSIELANEDILAGSKASSGMIIKLPTANETTTYSCGRYVKSKDKKIEHSICFVFGNISIRKVGSFKLLFKLYEFKNYQISFKHEVISDKFSVFNPKKFPGAISSTDLTRFLYKYGAKVRQRKLKIDTQAAQSDKEKKRSYSFELKNQDSYSPNKKMKFDESKPCLKVSKPYLPGISPPIASQMINTKQGGCKTSAGSHMYINNGYAIPPSISSPISSDTYYPNPYEEYHSQFLKLSPKKPGMFIKQSPSFESAPYYEPNTNLMGNNRRILLTQNNIQREVNYRQPQIFLTQPSGEKQRVPSLSSLYNSNQNTHISPGPLTAPLMESSRSSFNSGSPYFQHPSASFSRRSSTAMIGYNQRAQSFSHNGFPPMQSSPEVMRPVTSAASPTDTRMNLHFHAGFHPPALQDQHMRHQQYMFEQQKQLNGPSRNQRKLQSFSHYLY